VAYGVAKELGFAKNEVEWTVVPFNSSYAPGPKDFDFDINQISITPQREKAVDFSRPYYTAPQAVVTPKNSEFANAETSPTWRAPPSGCRSPRRASTRSTR
jgi:polar amino acid transport system substrate-binding protein